MSETGRYVIVNDTRDRAGRAVQAAGRLALGAVFVSGGSKVLSAPDRAASAASEFLTHLKKRVPALAGVEDRQLVRLNAAIHFGAGLGLAAGLVPRLSALLLAGSLVPTTLAAFPYWSRPPGPERDRMFSDFMKNLALAGGLVSMAAAKPGKAHPS
jgi:putative oxidoreductase